MSLLVIFGAGASYDSINAAATFPHNNPTQRWTNVPYYRPPLALELFEDRINFNDALTRYPQAQGGIAELRMKASQEGSAFNIERELELIKQSGGSASGAGGASEFVHNLYSNTAELSR